MTYHNDNTHRDHSTRAFPHGLFDMGDQMILVILHGSDPKGVPVNASFTASEADVRDDRSIQFDGGRKILYPRDGHWEPSRTLACVVGRGITWTKIHLKTQ